VGRICQEREVQTKSKDSNQKEKLMWETSAQKYTQAHKRGPPKSGHSKHCDILDSGKKKREGGGGEKAAKSAPGQKRNGRKA